MPRRNDYCSQVRAYFRVSARNVPAIRNLATHIDSVGQGESRLPVSVNESEPDNTWVCSPYTTYAKYSIEELLRLRRPWLTGPLTGVCRLFGTYLWNAGLDEAVAINNWLLSTNLYPELQSGAIGPWLEEAIDRWPTKAVWFRSLNTRYTPDWIAELSTLGFKLIPSRQVYLYDQVSLAGNGPQNLRRDIKLLNSRAVYRCEGDTWVDSDFERAAELYSLLYLKKYSELNPHYTADFIKSWCHAGLLNLSGFRDTEGTLQAVIGLFSIGDVVTAPIVGYDTEVPVKAGLYRQLMAAVFEQAALTQSRINLSAGAAHFKRLRGGVATIEYSAVYDRHLPRNRRNALALLSALSRRLGVPVMQRLEL